MTLSERESRHGASERAWRCEKFRISHPEADIQANYKYIYFD